MRQVFTFLSLCTLAACPAPEPLDPTTTVGASSTSLTTTATGTATATAATTGPVTGDTGTTAATTTTTGSSSSTTTSTTTTGEPSTTGEPGTTGPVDNGPCLGYKLVLDKPGAVLWVNKDQSVYESTFLQPGEGFYCVRVEFDLQTLDNLADIAATYPDGCPELLGLASVYGTQISGDVIATSFFHGMDLVGETCTPGPSRIEVGNYLDYIADTQGPWSPGQVWHIILESKPWLTRITIFNQGKQLGETIAADLFPADVEDTRDPVVRLGLPMPVEDRFYPWYGATYANVQVWADVAPAAAPAAVIAVPRAAESTIDIDAPPAHVWAVMLDFAHYHEWNPFIIRAELAGPLVLGAALRLQVRWSDGTGAGSGERITELTAPTDCEPGRLVYRFTGWLPALGLVRATRLQRLDPLAGERTRYFTREEFTGLLTAALPMARIQDGFERHARALKARAETASPP